MISGLFLAITVRLTYFIAKNNYLCTAMQFLQLILCLSLLVILHEFGHFITAKIFGVRVEKFYLFFNPWFSLVKFKPKGSETEYGIGWLPFGGYVKLAGMIDESLDTEQMARPAQPWEFRSKPAWQRLIIMSAGVVMHFLTAIVIFSMVLYSRGEEYVRLQDATMGMEFSEVAHNQGFRDGDVLLEADGEPLEAFDEENLRKILDASTVTVMRDGERKTLTMTRTFKRDLVGSKSGFADFRIPFIVKDVIASTPAEAAGLMAGDSIVGINGKEYVAWTDFTPVIRENSGVPMQLDYYRGGERMTTTLTPDTLGKIGVYVTPYYEIYPVTKHSYGFWESFSAGISKGVKTFTGYGSDFKMVFTKEGAENLGGFGTITKMFPDSINWLYFWYMTAYLSIILAFMNILPIPALDGGHIIFLLYEIITRKQLSQEFMIRMQQIGLLLLLALLLYANGMDIIRALQ